MLSSFSIVGTNVLIIFILIIVGFFCGKIKMITDESVKGMNSIMLNIVTPCVIISSLQQEFDATLLKNFFLAVLSAVISHALSFVIGFLIIRDKDESRRKTLQFAAMFSNCGFMALPLIEAICGSEGLIYGAAYILVFNFIGWTYGISMMSGTKEVSIKKALINPGVIPSIIGLVLFIFSISLPEIILTPMEHFAGLNTPVPMLIIGYTISQLKFEDFFKLKDIFAALLIRLIITPAALMAVLYLIGIRGILFTTAIISASTPVAAMTTMFAIKFDRDYSLGSKLVAVSSLFSVFTMTVIVSVAKFLSV